MTVKTIKGAFEAICPDLVIDKNWLRKLARQRIQFTLRNDEHIAFFGGNLFGVNVVRFTTLDRAWLFEELMGIDEVLVDKALDQVPTIIRRFVVTGDNFNNACIWLMYKIFTAPGLSAAEKQTGMMDVGLYLNYRFFTSLMGHRFHYPADPEVALATYAGLSRKFAIKQYGSWNKVFEERVKDMISPRSIHYKAITTMDDDLGVRYCIQDTQGRLRSMATLLMSEHMQRSEEKSKVLTSTSIMKHDGEEILKDRVKGLSTFITYLQDSLADERTFIKTDLIGVIEDLLPTMPVKPMLNVLAQMSSDAKKVQRKEIDTLVSDTLIHAFSYLYKNRQTSANTTDLAFILGSLKGTYTSSRNRDPSLLRLRKDMEQYVKHVTKIKHGGTIAAVRSGVLLYLVARTMTRSHYTGN